MLCFSPQPVGLRYAQPGKLILLGNGKTKRKECYSYKLSVLIQGDLPYSSYINKKAKRLCKVNTTFFY